MRGKLVQRQGCPPRSGSPEPTASQDEQQQQQQQQQYTMRLPQPYMKQIKLHPSGCQQWSSQVRLLTYKNKKCDHVTAVAPVLAQIL